AEGAEGAAQTNGETSADHPDTHQAEAPSTESAVTPHESHPDNFGQAREAEAQPAEPHAETAQPEPAVAQPEGASAAGAASDAAEAVTAQDGSPATESPGLAPENGNQGEDAGNVIEIEEPAAAENGEEE